jgi:hypothetical protein
MSPRRLLVTLALAPLWLGIAPTSQAAPPDPGFHQPDAGACHQYGVEGLSSNSDSVPPVSCDGPHTALTVASISLPQRVDIADAFSIFSYAGDRCLHAWNDAVSPEPTTRALSAYAVTFFIPSDSELARGARWVRCDVYLSGGNQLQQLPVPLISGPPLDDAVARCTRRSGLGAALTVCARKHSYRAVAFLQLHGTYPTPEQFARIAARRCPALAGGRYRFDVPNLFVWQAGTRGLVCSRKTHH